MIELSTESQIMLLGVVWLACVLVVCARGLRGGSVGLPIAYVIATTALYCGAISYANPEYSHLRFGGDLYLQSKYFTERTVLVGFATSTLGVAGFTLGVLLTSRSGSSRRSLGEVARNSPSMNTDLFLFALLCTGVAGFAIDIMQIRFPLSGAVSLAAQNAPVIAICLGAWFDVKIYGRVRYLRWGVVLGMTCAAYITLMGFASYAFVTIAITIGFWFRHLRPRWFSGARMVIASIGGFYLTVSVFIAWMSFRSDFRAATWGGQSMWARLQELGTLISNVSFLSFADFDSLDLLNARFNQAIYVGKAVEFHELNPSLKLHGETLWMSLIAWIPRFLWPEKPELGGSTLMSEHTGLVFAERVTFGAGPIFEFFVNFGHIGVFLGMLALGALLSLIDQKAFQKLKGRQIVLFAAWFALGMVFIDPLLTSFFIVSGGVFSWLLVVAIAISIKLTSPRVSAIQPKEPAQEKHNRLR